MTTISFPGHLEFIPPRTGFNEGYKQEQGLSTSAPLEISLGAHMTKEKNCVHFASIIRFMTSFERLKTRDGDRNEDIENPFYIFAPFSACFSVKISTTFQRDFMLVLVSSHKLNVPIAIYHRRSVKY